MTITAFLYGSYALLLGQMTEGTLIEVLGLLVSLEGISFMLPQNLLMIRGGYVNAQRIVNILGWRDPLSEPENEEQHVDWNGDIVFENVSFAYGRGTLQGESYALTNLNVTIPSGSRVALIGSPGSGKSTVLKLLLRFYDPAEGRITVGGVDLKNVSTKAVRSHVGMVEQDVFLFMASVKDNIAFGRTDPTMEEIQDAARRAQAEEFILQMPEGYDTLIGERGMTLSGGQRQRLAIARAIIHDPEILLLDDSVSAVDARTEYMMRKALNEVMTGRTSITVTQRLRTLVESDLILILDKGTLIGAGTHAQLLKSSEHYRRIFERLPGAAAMIKPARARRGGK
jgi:ATP-binding cassette subfamily B protein